MTLVLKQLRLVRLPEEVTSAAFDPGTIPLIVPSDALRRDRWSDVLSWYGLDETRTLRLEVSSEMLPGKNPVICLDPASARLASWYANVLNRPLVETGPKESAGWAKLFASLTGQTLFVGLGSSFNAATIRLIAAAARARPWSIATAYDVPGLSFFLAKQIARRSLDQGGAHSVPNSGIALLDAIGRRVATSASTVVEPRQSQFDGSVVSQVLASNWGTIVIHAHGEGGHADLHNSVLCGRVGQAEKGSDGTTISGCSAGPPAKCKRVQDPNIAIFSFGDLHAERVAFYSCNGFSVAGELYPSNVSCALAMADGYPSQMLCNDRPGHMHPSALDGRLSQLLAGIDLLSLCDLENRRQADIDGTTPWLVLGDTYDVSWPAEPPTGGCDHQSPIGTAFLAGGTMPRSGISGQTIAQLMRRTARCADLEFNLGYVWEPVGDSDDLRALASRLRDHRLNVEDALRLAARCEQRVWDGGLDNDDVNAALEVADEFIADWDESFAGILFNYAIAGDVEHLSMGGQNLEYLNARDSCGRCGEPLLLLRGDNLTTNGASYGRRCAVCGPKDTWFDDGPRLEAELPITVRRHENIALTASIHRPYDAPSTERRRGGVLLGAFKNKATGRVFYKEKWAITGDSCAITIEMPGDLDFDLHTLQLAYVEAMCLTTLRLRVPCLPG